MPLRFSAIISNYNHGAYIGDAVESVLANRDPHTECIVVDDGSTDCTREALAPYANDGRVKVIYKENGGQASAFNAGFAVAQGDVICLFDGDDFWFPFKIRALREKIAEHDLAGTPFFIRHPLQRVYSTELANAHADRDSFSVFDQMVKIPVGGFQRVCTAEQYRSLLAKHRFPIYVGGDFGGSTVAARSVIEKIFPLPEAISKHYGDMYPSMSAGLVADVYGFMMMLGVYRLHGANHSISRPREPYTFWKGIEAYANEVLVRAGQEPNVDFDASIGARRYLMEQGRFSEAFAAARARAAHGLRSDASLKGRLATYALAAKYRFNQMVKGPQP